MAKNRHTTNNLIYLQTFASIPTVNLFDQWFYLHYYFPIYLHSLNFQKILRHLCVRVMPAKISFIPISSLDSLIQQLRNLNNTPRAGSSFSSSTLSSSKKLTPFSVNQTQFYYITNKRFRDGMAKFVMDFEQTQEKYAKKNWKNLFTEKNMIRFDFKTDKM